MIPSNVAPPSYRTPVVYEVRLESAHAALEVPFWLHERWCGSTVELLDLLLAHEDVGGCSLHAVSNFDPQTDEPAWVMLCIVPVRLDADSLEEWACRVWGLVKEWGYPHRRTS